MANDIYKKIAAGKIFDDSELYTKDDPPIGFLSSGIIIMNAACSGKIDGAFGIGKITLFSAHSMLGKTIIGMVAVRDAQKKGMYCVILDAEYQWDWKLAEKIGIDNDPEKICVFQNNQIEEIQEKIMQIAKELTKEERKNVFFMLDSWGALVNYEGVRKAADAESKKDFVLTQKKNNLANMIMYTQCTFYIANGVYDNVGGFGDLLKIPGGRRIILNSHTVILGKSKAADKEKKGNDEELTGAIISCQMHKTRFSKEKTEFQFRINYDGGLDIFYGILPYAIDGGYVKEDGNSYVRTCVKVDKKWKAKNLYCAEFWTPIFKETDFGSYLEKQCTFQNNFDIKDETFYDDLTKIVEVEKKDETDKQK